MQDNHGEKPLQPPTLDTNITPPEKITTQALDYNNFQPVDEKMSALIANELEKDRPSKAVFTPRDDAVVTKDTSKVYRWLKFVIYTILAFWQVLFSMFGLIIAIFSINSFVMSLSLILIVSSIMVPIRSIHFMVRTGFDIKSWVERLSLIVMMTPLMVYIFFAIIEIFSVTRSGTEADAISAATRAVSISWFFSPAILIGYVAMGRCIARRKNSNAQTAHVESPVSPAVQSVSHHSMTRPGRKSKKFTITWILAGLVCITIIASTIGNYLPSTYQSAVVNVEVQNTSKVSNEQVEQELYRLRSYLMTTYHENFVFDSVEVKDNVAIVFGINTSSISASVHPEGRPSVSFQIYRTIRGQGIEGKNINGESPIRENYLAKKFEKQYSHTIKNDVREVFGQSVDVEIFSPTMTTTAKKSSYLDVSSKTNHEKIITMSVNVTDEGLINSENIQQYAQRIFDLIEKNKDMPYHLAISYTIRASPNQDGIKGYKLNFTSTNHIESPDDLLKEFTRSVEGTASKQNYDPVTQEFIR